MPAGFEQRRLRVGPFSAGPPNDLILRLDMAEFGKMLVVFGLGAAVLGALLWGLSIAAPGLRLGRLPGDIVYEQGGAKVFIPITTMLLASVVLSLVLWLVSVVRR